MQTEPLNVQGAASHVGVTPGYLNNMRHNGKGPEFTKRGHRVEYTVAALDAWNEGRKAKRTARAEAADAKAKRLAAHAADLRSGKAPSRKRKAAENTATA